MTAAACLVITAVCVLTAVVLFVGSTRRDGAFLGLAALTAMVIGAISATVYGGLSS